MVWLAPFILGLATPIAAPIVADAVSLPVRSPDAIATIDVVPGRLVDAPRDAARMLRDLNVMRAQRHLPPLSFDPRLAIAARAHALEMLRERYFAHVAPNGTTPIDRLAGVGVRTSWIGENLALNRNEPAAFDALCESAPHRENMLEVHFAHVGIAAIRTDDAGELFVEDFTN